MITIYHNPRCQKSRAALNYIETLGDKITVIDYIKNPPTVKELSSILKLMGKHAEDIVRKKEELYKTSYAGKKMTEEQWIEVLSEHPILIERPILVKGKVAIIGRDEESLQKIG